MPIPKKVVEVEDDSDEIQVDTQQQESLQQEQSLNDGDPKAGEQAKAPVAVETSIPTTALDFSQPLKPPKL